MAISRAAYLASLSPALRARQLELAAELDAPRRSPPHASSRDCIAPPSLDDAAIIARERMYADQRAQRRADAGE